MGVATEIEKKTAECKLTERECERGEIVEKKRKGNDFQVAFCGHFSAGKSTILNHLLGAEMLPTSPIPTSANIIGIKNGELGLSVQMIDGDKTNWAGEIPWERVREWGMNGGEIASIQIEAPLPFLGEESIIYDTPGVDSTDPTHQAVTLEALYTTDFIVYVMDYNHVQSETNLTFLKQLSDEKKPLYLVINQIDKHDEQELSFVAFDQSVRNTFSEWGINILKLCYTSMKSQDHRLSQLAEFEQNMKAMLYHGNELLPFAKQRLQQGYNLSIAHRLNGDQDDEIDAIKEEMKKEGYSLEQLDQRETVATAYEQTLQAEKKFIEKMEAELLKLTKDVTIFPYTTTELTRHWLESMEPNFKVGMLFTKKKTEEEQENRIKRLVAEVNDKVKSQLEFHLYRLFQAHDFTLLSNREQVERALEQLTLTLGSRFFIDAIQSGPKSREYVYTFTKDRTDAVIRELRQKATTVLLLMSKGMEEHWENERLELKHELDQLQALNTYVVDMQKVEQHYDELKVQYREKAAQFQDAGGYERVLMESMQKEIPIFKRASTIAEISLPTETVIDTNWNDDITKVTTPFDEKAANAWGERLTAMLDSYRDDQRMSHERQLLLERTKKFQQQTFTISLFGAFSAGKSSFANALLGGNVLPVSPHPTTATVNTVKQSEPGHRSHTAIVKVKTRAQLDEEVQSVAEQLDLKLSIDTLQTWQPDVKVAITSWQKTYQTYLMTLKNSINSTKWDLGSDFEVGLEELQPFVANEHDACLINEVTLYYDCPLTKKGIVLVDTPGVNSIHGRHTNVAFKQLRNSDAIFYLSYYNHAFSRADQTFLEQIGKINDDFRTDKLYFILNAADLASSPYELNGVLKHVHDQLIQCGIDRPRLYPVSSKKGLEGKQRGEVVDQLFATFERAFYEQTIAELQRLSYDLLRDEAKQYATVLAKGVEYATSEESTKQEKRSELAGEVQSMIEQVTSMRPFTAFQTANQEVNQLFLYLRERIRYVLGDQYQAYVNVTTVVGSSKKAQQKSLLLALQEWRNEGEYFLQQEIQATFIRLELAFHRSIAEWISETVNGIRTEFPAFSHSFEQPKQELRIDLSDRILPIPLEDYSTTIQSLKSFFEQQQARKLKEEVVEKGSELASEQLKRVEAQTLVQLETIFEQTIQLAKTHINGSLARELERFDAMMDPIHHVALKQEYLDIQELFK